MSLSASRGDALKHHPSVTTDSRTRTPVYRTRPTEDVRRQNLIFGRRRRIQASTRPYPALRHVEPPTWQAATEGEDENVVEPELEASDQSPPSATALVFEAEGGLDTEAHLPSNVSGQSTVPGCYGQPAQPPHWSSVHTGTDLARAVYADYTRSGPYDPPAGSSHYHPPHHPYWSSYRSDVRFRPPPPPRRFPLSLLPYRTGEPRPIYPPPQSYGRSSYWHTGGSEDEPNRARDAFHAPTILLSEQHRHHAEDLRRATEDLERTTEQLQMVLAQLHREARPTFPPTRPSRATGAGVVDIEIITPAVLDAISTVVVGVGVHGTGMVEGKELRTATINDDANDSDRCNEKDSTPEEEEASCPVCQDTLHGGVSGHGCDGSMETPQGVRRLNLCGHEFHTDCLRGWLCRSVTCPICRDDFTFELSDVLPQSFFDRLERQQFMAMWNDDDDGDDDGWSSPSDDELMFELYATNESWISSDDDFSDSQYLGPQHY